MFSLLLAAPLPALDSSRHISEYVIDKWLTEDGLPSIAVNTIVQTKDGYLWLGTQGGISRFDGVKFTNFTSTNTEGIKTNWITRLFEDSRGTLWIGTNGGGLSYYKNGRFTQFGSEAGFTPMVISDIAEDSNGRVWVGTDGNGIVVIDKFKIVESFTTESGLLSNKVQSIAGGRLKEMWIGTFEGLNHYRNAGFSKITTNEGLSNNSVFGVYCEKDGTVWASTDNGLNRIKDSRITVYTTADGLASNTIYSIYKSRGGSLWLCTDSGISRREGNRFSSLRRSDSLINSRVFIAMEDHEGSLWFGTHGAGLIRLREDKYITYSAKDGLPGTMIWTIMQDRKGTLWIGSDSAGLIKRVGRKYVNYTTRDGLTNNSVNALFADVDGSIWIGTRGGGVNILKNGKFRYLTKADGLSTNRIRAILRDSAGRMWIATSNGLNLITSGGIRIFTKSNGLIQDSVRGIFEDKAGKIWIATEGGISVYERGRFTNYTRDQGLPDSKVYTFHQDEEGIIWFGVGTGLGKYSEGKFSFYSAEDGLFDDVGCRIFEDSKGFLWIGGHKGIYKISKRDIKNFDRGVIQKIPKLTLDPLCNGGVQPAGWMTEDENMYFPTPFGVVMVNPYNIKQNEQPPKVVIEELTVDNEVIDLSSSDKMRIREFEPGAKRLEFKFTGLSFLQPEYVKFKYRLEGFDEDWVDSGTRRSAFYTNLRHGKYTFRVVACNNDNIWNIVGAQITFRLKPAFTQTGWFYTILALIIIVISFGIYELRVLSLNRQKRKLQNLVEEKTGELKTANEKLADANKDLDRKVKKRTEELERINRELVHAAQIKSDFLANVSHELRTPLSSILGYTELLRRDDMDFNRDKQKHFLEVINDQGEHLLQLVSSLLDVNTLESGAVNLHLRKENVNEIVNKAIKQQWHKFDDPEQNITLELDENVEPVYLDVEKIAHVLSSLVDNAVKFCRTDNQITIKTAWQDKHIKITVSDRGIGIPKSQIEHVFDPFFQVDSSSTRKYGGTGLGLYLVKNYIDLHDGDVKVESKEGKGTTFILTIPTDLKPVERKITRSKPKSSDKQQYRSIEGRTVLVIDDNSDVADLVKIILGDNFTVLSAENGKDGIDKTMEANPCLIFMDLAMPGISGFEATKQLKKNSSTKNIPVIALSARTMPEEIKRALQAGCDEHIPKPFNVETISQIVKRYCERGK